MLATILFLIVFGIVGWYSYDTYVGYRDAIGSTWERLKAAFSYSATLAWARLNAISVALTYVVAQAADWMGIPGVKEALAPFLTPGWLLTYTIIVLVGADIARRRTL